MGYEKTKLIKTTVGENGNEKERVIDVWGFEIKEGFSRRERSQMKGSLSIFLALGRERGYAHL